MGTYPSDLSDVQWAQVVEAFRPYSGAGRPRTSDTRRVVDALLYRLRTGCQWRQLPLDFPDWHLVSYYFAKWTGDGTLERLHDRRRTQARLRAGRAPAPTAAILDSQTAKSTPVTAATGYDAGEKNEGTQAAHLGRHPRPSLGGAGACRSHS